MRLLPIFPILAIAALTPIAASNAQNQRWQSTSTIDQAVTNFTGAATGTTGGARSAVDRRLRLVLCRNPLAASWRNVRRDMVVVECPDRGGWRMFVPVLRERTVQASTAKPPVKRGQAVTISVRGRGFAVSRPGEALEHGRIGEWIRVKPLSGNETLKARIVDPGLVEVALR